MYLYISFFEWLLHSQVMHGNPDILCRFPFVGEYLAQTARSHLAHHRQVQMNMRFDDTYQTDQFRWIEVIIFVLLTFLLLVPLTRFGAVKLIGGSVIIAMLYGFLWNHIHNQMHESKGIVKWTKGPSNFLPPFYVTHGWYQRLLKHHSIHHLQKGSKYNFNIIFLGCDWLMNTLKKNDCYDNTDYCKKEQDHRCQQSVKRCL